MNTFLTEHLRQGLMLGLALSLPVVLTAATVGLVVGILQAVTQVQEQTIAAAPKITLVFLVIIFGGGVMMDLVHAYMREAAKVAFDDIPVLGGPRVLPPQPQVKRARFRFRDQFPDNPAVTNQDAVN